MLIDENWAIGDERIREFFRSQSDVTELDGTFRYGNCRITLTSLPNTQNGIFVCQRTGIRMEGPDEDVQIIHRRFFLRFLSAGG